ncbi:MAG: CopG family transcriptional regulator [Phycisphaerae bacterium]
MKVVQMTLDEELIEATDKIARKLHMTRSGFTRMALRTALKEYRKRKMVEKHRKGYEKHPVKKDEFDLWEPEQIWEE